MNGLYQVSNLGNVKTLSRTYYSGVNYSMERSIKEKLLKSRILKNSGYKMIKLMKDGKAKHSLVHRLVAEAFIPNLENKPQVNHKDGDKLNNNANNLEWVSGEENIQHAIKCKLINMDRLKTNMSRVGKRKGHNNNSWKGYVNVYTPNNIFKTKCETLKDTANWIRENTNYKNPSIGNICTAIKKGSVVYGFRYEYDNATGERVGGFGSTGK